MLILLIVFIFSITSVSANDFNATDAIAIGEVNEVISEVNINKEIISNGSESIVGENNNDYSDIQFSNNISFKYGETGFAVYVVGGGSINSTSVSILNHSKANIIVENNKISVSGLDAGNYQLSVEVVPDENHTGIVKTLDVNVDKASATIKVSKLTVAHKANTAWSIKVVDSNGKAIANAAVTLKIYTGNKYITVNDRTNSKGVVTYKTSKLSVGTHKVIVSLLNANYAAKSVSTSIKVIKQTALKFKLVQKANTKKGSLISCLVLNKKTGKGINGIKIKVLVYTGKKYTTFTLKTKKLKGSKVYNGALGFSTNKYSVGKHVVKLMPASMKYSGSYTTSINIKKSATKYPKYIWIV